MLNLERHWRIYNYLMGLLYICIEKYVEFVWCWQLTYYNSDQYTWWWYDKSSKCGYQVYDDGLNKSNLWMNSGMELGLNLEVIWICDIILIFEDSNTDVKVIDIVH